MENSLAENGKNGGCPPHDINQIIIPYRDDYPCNGGNITGLMVCGCSKCGKAHAVPGENIWFLVQEERLKIIAAVKTEGFEFDPGKKPEYASAGNIKPSLMERVRKFFIGLLWA